MRGERFDDTRVMEEGLCLAVAHCFVEAVEELRAQFGRAICLSVPDSVGNRLSWSTFVDCGTQLPVLAIVGGSFDLRLLRLGLFRPIWAVPLCGGLLELLRF
jgi:hypothetical protein